MEMLKNTCVNDNIIIDAPLVLKKQNNKISVLLNNQPFMEMSVTGINPSGSENPVHYQNGLLQVSIAPHVNETKCDPHDENSDFYKSVKSYLCEKSQKELTPQILWFAYTHFSGKQFEEETEWYKWNGFGGWDITVGYYVTFHSYSEKYTEEGILISVKLWAELKSLFKQVKCLPFMLMYDNDAITIDFGNIDRKSFMELYCNAENGWIQPPDIC
jgi:hypothetical protein